MASKKAANGPWFYSKALGFLRNQSRTYILPTAFGGAFTGVVLVLFVMAIGFANNLIYLLTFLLVSIAITAMILANQNIAQLKISKVRFLESFAGEPSDVQIQLESVNPSRTLWELEFRVAGKDIPMEKRALVNGSLEVLLSWIPQQRGWQKSPKISVKSRYPFGLFRAWQRDHSKEDVLIFATRKGSSHWPHGQSGDEDPSSVGVFKEHREYQNSDSWRRIDWKASARRQEILIKTYEDDEERILNFNWVQTQGLEDFESKVSQLALWVDLAYRRELHYSLTIGSHKIAIGSGKEHFLNCQTLLATIEESDLR